MTRNHIFMVDIASSSSHFTSRIWQWGFLLLALQISVTSHCRQHVRKDYCIFYQKESLDVVKVWPQIPQRWKFIYIIRLMGVFSHRCFPTKDLLVLFGPITFMLS